MTDAEVANLITLLEQQIAVWQKNAAGATSRDLLMYSLGFQYGLATAKALLTKVAASS